MNAVELAAHVGVTYRRVDYWIRIGYIKPIGDSRPGTGHERVFSLREVEVCAWMAELIRAGFRPGIAARIARWDHDAWTAALTALGEGWTNHSEAAS